MERFGRFSFPHTCSSTAEGTLGAYFVPRHVLVVSHRPTRALHGPEEGVPSTAARVAMEMRADVKGRRAA